VAEVAQVGLVPRGVGWVATFHAPGWHLTTYVDMTSVPWWDGTTCRAVDLDLDVVRGAGGEVVVDDEDEFAVHQVRYGYPPEVVSLAEESCAWVLEQVRAGRAPFDEATAARWFEVHATYAG
jgi:protein associated with RNAse G/E